MSLLYLHNYYLCLRGLLMRRYINPVKGSSPHRSVLLFSTCEHTHSKWLKQLFKTMIQRLWVLTCMLLAAALVHASIVATKRAHPWFWGN